MIYCYKGFPLPLFPQRPRPRWQPHSSRGGCRPALCPPSRWPVRLEPCSLTGPSLLLTRAVTSTLPSHVVVTCSTLSVLAGRTFIVLAPQGLIGHDLIGLSRAAAYVGAWAPVASSSTISSPCMVRCPRSHCAPVIVRSYGCCRPCGYSIASRRVIYRGPAEMLLFCHDGPPRRLYLLRGYCCAVVAQRRNSILE